MIATPLDEELVTAAEASPEQHAHGQQSPAAPPQGRAASSYFQPLQAGDVLESTLQHRAICASALLLGGISVAKIVLILASGVTWRMVGGMAAAALFGYEFADFGSGVYHWSMDNYGNKDTPIWGKQVARARHARLRL